MNKALVSLSIIMKKIFIAALSITLVIACNSDKKPKSDTTKPLTQVDSLLNYIEEGHMEGMGKIGRLHNTRKAVQAIIDSISHLPGKLQSAAAAYTDQLKSTIKDLDYADTAMDKWMMEYQEDSASSKETERIKYLSGEKDKIEAIKKAIRNSLQKADSLLKVRL